MKSILITGANKSIGFETARQLLQQGHSVWLGARDAAKGEAAAEQLRTEGLSRVKPLVIDVTDAASILAARQTVETGGGGLDVLINNAGIPGAFPQPPGQTPAAVLREVFDTNFFGVIAVTQAFLPLLGRAALPVIVNVTSGLASLTKHSDPSWRFYAYKSAAYGPSKTALNAYTVALSFELKDKGFKVNAVDPGYTATDFNHHTGTKAVSDAAADIVAHALLDAAGPTGLFFSRDNEASGISPW